MGNCSIGDAPIRLPQEFLFNFMQELEQLQQKWGPVLRPELRLNTEKVQAEVISLERPKLRLK